MITRNCQIGHADDASNLILTSSSKYLCFRDNNNDCLNLFYYGNYLIYFFIEMSLSYSIDETFVVNEINCTVAYKRHKLVVAFPSYHLNILNPVILDFCHETTVNQLFDLWFRKIHNV